MKEYLLFLLIPVLFIVSMAVMRRRNSLAAQEHWDKEEKDVEILFDNGEVLKIEKEDVDDSDNHFVFVRYRGEVLPMRKFEKREYWNKYDRRQRNEHLEGVKKAIKKGYVVREWLDDEKTICGLIPVTGNLRKLKEDYKNFIKLGGELKDE